jgi:hypothetical protein
MGGRPARRPLKVVLAGVHTAAAMAALSSAGPSTTKPPIKSGVS